MKTRIVAAAAALSLAGAASAHHSFAMFDSNKVVTMDGTVKNFQWTNPHSWLDVTVTDANGGTALWSIEMGGPAALYRAGWRQDSVKPGDKIQFQAHPLRDGRTGGSLMSVKLANGTVLSDRAATGR